MTATDEDLHLLLTTDPLRVAEDITGKSYKDDPITEGLGFRLHLQRAAAKQEALTARGDTTLHNTLDRYVGIITDYGFERVLKLAFEASGRLEHFFVYWHPTHGLLLSFDSYHGTHVNGGAVRYNWRPDCDNRWDYTSSGHSTEDGTWIGDHDCREALIYHMENLRTHGTFVTPWVEQPFMWLLHYGDTRHEDYDYPAINAERIAMLPQHVQDAIRGTDA